MSRKRLTPRELAAVAEAAALLAALRVVVGRVGFARLARYAGLVAGETDAPTDIASAERVGLAVRRAAAHLPFECTCLMQALGGASMLRRRHLRGTLQLGVAKDAADSSGLAAHAWLRAGDVVLVGGAGANAYTPVAAYHV